MTKLVETRKYKSKTLSSIKGCELVFFRDGQETLGEREREREREITFLALPGKY